MFSVGLHDVSASITSAASPATAKNNRWITRRRRFISSHHCAP